MYKSPIVENRINKKMAETEPPATIHGRKCPHLVLVLSIAFPIKGSINNSIILITAIKMVTMLTILASVALSPVSNKCEVINTTSQPDIKP